MQTQFIFSNNAFPSKSRAVLGSWCDQDRGLGDATNPGWWSDFTTLVEIGPYSRFRTGASQNIFSLAKFRTNGKQATCIHARSSHQLASYLHLLWQNMTSDPSISVNLARKDGLSRILVVDDYSAWRDYACRALQQEPEFQVVAAVSDGLEAVQRAQELRPDLLILDLGLPKLNGIEVARRIRRLLPQTKILFLSEQTSPDIVQAALNTGANGYVLKSCAEGDLRTAAKTVLANQVFISRTLKNQLPLT